MNGKSIEGSGNPFLIGTYRAMQRAFQRARELAIRTNTAIIVMRDGKITRITAAELIAEDKASSCTKTA